MRGSGYGMMNGAWGGWLGPIHMMLFLGLFIAAIVVLVRGFSRANQPAHEKTALEVLEECHARGKVNR